MLIRNRRARGLVLPGAFTPRSDTWLPAGVAAREPVPTGARVLELCAGPGQAGIVAARAHGGHLTTVDVSRRAVLTARTDARPRGGRPASGQGPRGPLMRSVAPDRATEEIVVARGRAHP